MKSQEKAWPEDVTMSWHAHVKAPTFLSVLQMFTWLASETTSINELLRLNVIEVVA